MADTADTDPPGAAPKLLSRPVDLGDVSLLQIARSLQLSFSPLALFESLGPSGHTKRYAFLALLPDLIVRVADGQAGMARDENGFAAMPDSGAYDNIEGNPLQALRDIEESGRFDLGNAPPMASGLLGHIGYEMVRFMEDLPDPRASRAPLPEALMMRPGVVLVHDRADGNLTAYATRWPDETGEAAGNRLDAVLNRLASDPGSNGKPRSVMASDMRCLSKPGAYQKAVKKAREYAFAGDIFQVVLSQDFEADYSGPPLALYEALRDINPSPFLYCLLWGDVGIVGASPEIMVRVRKQEVTIRPIAGTRPRGKTAEEDDALEAELLSDPKERAEHLMLLDLGRNDVGRVSQPGTVRVTQEFAVERYSHVMHIVSQVSGKLRQDYEPIDAFIAGFPAGTVSGAPKIRAMEIIHELETTARSIYAGAIGYFGANGDMDTCIALRTGIIHNGKLSVRAGAGIVTDSDPDAEDRECHNKAMALFAAAKAAANSG